MSDDYGYLKDCVAGILIELKVHNQSLDEISKTLSRYLHKITEDPEIQNCVICGKATTGLYDQKIPSCHSCSNGVAMATWLRKNGYFEYDHEKEYSDSASSKSTKDSPSSD